MKSKGKIKDDAIHKFKRESRSFLAALCKHMVEKSPLQSSFAHCTRALNPVYMAENLESCKVLFDKMLQKLVEYKQVLPNIADFAMQEFDCFLTFIVKAKKRTFCDFDFNASQLDDFFMHFLKDYSHYKNLTKVIKIIKTLSHGQSEVERGFSINENALVDNMQMETIIAQRKVNGYMRKIIFNLILCQCQRRCYKMPSKLISGIKKALDEKQKQKNKKSGGAIKIEKEIAALNAQKSQVEIAIEEYKKEADKCAFEAENKENLELLKLSNSLKLCF